MSTRQGASQELVYAQAIPLLASGLYPRKLMVVREYIQNASDAIDSYLRISDELRDGIDPIIKVSVQGRSLLIWDNGIGMDGEEIEKLKRVAYSEKQEGREAGFKGIGRLAGIGVADKLIISSTTYGNPLAFKFEFRAGDFNRDAATKRRQDSEFASEAINRHTDITSFEVDPRDHYTLVELRDIDAKHPELLDPIRLREFIGELAPVGFAPNFAYNQNIQGRLFSRVPDYSPKAIWLTTAAGERSQVFKPYSDSMELAEPDFIEVEDPDSPGRLLAFCWYSTKGMEMLGRFRQAGGRFTVEGKDAAHKKRLSGLVYKLFGFSIGERSLTLMSLWGKEIVRALWFTGEIHIVDKGVRPTTDRSELADNDARRRLYEQARRRIAKRLDGLAQTISNNKNAFLAAQKQAKNLQEIRDLLVNGGIERAEFGKRKRVIDEAIKELSKRSCTDKEIESHVKKVRREAEGLSKKLDEAKSKKSRKDEISDLGKELHMTTHARKVYKIIMEALEQHFADDTQVFFDVSEAITKALRRKY